MNLTALTAALALVLSSAAHAATYIVAHPDDMELFMSGNLITDLSQGASSVIIVTTAGDAGAGAGAVTQDDANGENIYGRSYAQVRLNAHETAIRFDMSLSGQPIQKAVETVEVIEGHKIDVRTINNVKLYNLYLPDGTPQGTGYSNTGYQSLQRLYLHQIPDITSVDPRHNVYTSAELARLIADIISSNVSQGVSRYVNLQDPDASVNPNDHSDHTYTGKYAEAAVATLPCINKAKYQDYVTQYELANMSSSLTTDQTGQFGALNGTLTNQGNPSTFESSHLAWIGRTYFTTVVPPGCDEK